MYLLLLNRSKASYPVSWLIHLFYDSLSTNLYFSNKLILALIIFIPFFLVSLKEQVWDWDSRYCYYCFSPHACDVSSFCGTVFYAFSFYLFALCFVCLSFFFFLRSWSGSYQDCKSLMMVKKSQNYHSDVCVLISFSFTPCPGFDL